MPVFGDAGNPDAYYGFTNQTFTNTGDPVVIDIESESFTTDVANFSSYACLWDAVISIDDFDASVIKFYGGGVGRANWGFYTVASRAVRFPLQYIEFTSQRVPLHKFWSYNPLFYSGNRYVPSEATYGALLSGDFPLDLGVNTKPVAAFSSVASPGDSLRVSLQAGVLSFSVQVNYRIWGTTLFPGATAPVTFIEI